MAGQLATASFDHQHPQAPDNRMQRPNLNARNEISPWIRWEGMQVYVVQEQKTYQLVGGTGNEHWQEIAAGGGASNFAGQFPTFDDLPNSGSPGDYAYVGTGDDFVQYNWDQIAEEWRLNSAETKVSDEDFFLGRVPSEPDKVMFSMRRNSIIYSTGGSQSISPDRMANYVFTGENVTLENVNYSGDGGEEFHITNRTGSNLTILSTGNFASGLTIPAGHMASFKSSDDGWVQSFVNEEATFSDTLDSVNARVSVGPDGKEVLSGIFDRNTGESVEFKEFDGTPPQPVDGIVWISKNSKIFRRVFDGAVKIQWFGAVADDPEFNSTPSIQAAIDSPYPDIDISGGTFYSSGIINLKSNKRISGNGILKKFLFQQSSPLINFPTDTQNVVIDGLELDSNAFFPDSAIGNGNSALRIYGANVKNIYFRNLIIRNTGRDGVYVNDNTGVKEPVNINVDNCKFFDITRNCVSVINGDGVHLTNNYYNKWNLCAIDFEPNSATKHLPNRNHTVLNSTFVEYDFPGTQGRTTVQATTGSSGATTEDIERYGNIRVEGNVLEVNTVKTSNFFRSSAFPRCIIVNNHIYDVIHNSILLAGAPNSIVSRNKILNPNISEYDGDLLLSGVISLSASDNVVVQNNEIDGSNYNGIHVQSSNHCEISGNTTRNIGQAIGHSGSKSHIHLQNTNFCNVYANELDETETEAFATIGIRCYNNTGDTNFDNTIKDNNISDKIPSKINIGNIDRQRSIQNNDFTSDAFKNGRVITTLPTATEYTRGKIFRINSTGTNADKFYTTILNNSVYEWVEIFKEYRTSVTTNSVSRTFITTDVQWYLRFTGAAGDLTIPQNTFVGNQELYGEIEGGAKTFVAGSGVTLRYPSGGTNVAPTNSRFFIKFKSPNDAQLTIVPGVGISGVSEFTELDDVSVSSLTGHSGKTFVVDPNGEELIPQLLPIKTIRTSGTNNYSPSISGTDPFFILENDFSWLEEYYNNGFRVIKIKVWGFVSNGASSILTFQLFSDNTSGTVGVGVEGSTSDTFSLEIDIHIRSSTSSRAFLRLTKTGATTDSEVFQAINFSDFDRDFDENRSINIQGAFDTSSGSNGCLIRSYEIQAY